MANQFFYIFYIPLMAELFMKDKWESIIAVSSFFRLVFLNICVSFRMVKPGGQNKSSQQSINPVPAAYNVIKALLERTQKGGFNLHLQSCVMLCWF